MNHPILGVLAILFAILGALSAYFLVLGMREGRFSRRVNTFPPVRGSGSTGREPGYMYRDRDGFDFWMEAFVRVTAVAACMIAIVTTIMAP